MRKSFIALVLCAISLCLPFNAYATDTFPEGLDCSIQLSVRYNGTDISGGSFCAIRIGTMDDQALFRQEITGQEIQNIYDPTESENQEAFYREHKNTHSFYTQTQPVQNGKVVFSNLVPGVYLIVQEEACPGFYKQNAFLVGVPYMDNGRYQYQTVAEAKLKPEESAPEDPSPGATEPSTLPSDSVLPDTGQMNWPVPILVITGMLLLSIGYFLYRQKGTKADSFLMIAGTLFVLGALGLLAFNQHEAYFAGQASETLTPKIREQISQQQDGPESLMLPAADSAATGSDMAQIEIDGANYIGCLSIPDLGLDLPISADWDNSQLRTSPCRYFGSTATGNLVIMAHNYRQHFGKLAELSEGDSVYFTDVRGAITQYQVLTQDVVQPVDVAEVTSGIYDLALFTCTYDGANRVVIYCDAVASAIAEVR